MVLASVLGRAVVEVQANFLVGVNEVLLARQAEDAWGVVLVDVLGSQAIDGIRGEPGASDTPHQNSIFLLEHVSCLCFM